MEQASLRLLIHKTSINSKFDTLSETRKMMQEEHLMWMLMCTGNYTNLEKRQHRDERSLVSHAHACIIFCDIMIENIVHA